MLSINCWWWDSFYEEFGDKPSMKMTNSQSSDFNYSENYHDILLEFGFEKKIILDRLNLYKEKQKTFKKKVEEPKKEIKKLDLSKNTNALNGLFMNKLKLPPKQQQNS